MFLDSTMLIEAVNAAVVAVEKEREEERESVCAQASLRIVDDDGNSSTSKVNG